MIAEDKNLCQNSLVIKQRFLSGDKRIAKIKAMTKLEMI